MKVILKKVERIFDEYFKINRAVIQYEKFDGTITKDLVRYNLERGNSVAVLLVNSQKQSIILTKQFRYPAYTADKSNGWLLEIVAGTIEEDANPQETAEREVLEEVGYTIDKLVPVCSFFPSPGGSSEKIILFYAEVTVAQKIKTGGGLKGEGEDIEIIELPINETFRLLESGQIVDAKTIIALQWLKQKIAP